MSRANGNGTIREKKGKMMDNPKCYGCKYLVDVFGNYVECNKAAENGTHIFVDWFYYNDGAPECCPLKAMEGEKRKEEVQQ